jgi:hypothetical protein
MHPNGQIPAYEWNLATWIRLHSWAVWNVYNKDKEQTGEGDTVFLETAFQKTN